MENYIVIVSVDDLSYCKIQIIQNRRRSIIVGEVFIINYYEFVIRGENS